MRRRTSWEPQTAGTGSALPLRELAEARVAGRAGLLGASGGFGDGAAGRAANFHVLSVTSEPYGG